MRLVSDRAGRPKHSEKFDGALGHLGNVGHHMRAVLLRKQNVIVLARVEWRVEVDEVNRLSPDVSLEDFEIVAVVVLIFGSGHDAPRLASAARTRKCLSIFFPNPPPAFADYFPQRRTLLIGVLKAGRSHRLGRLSKPLAFRFKPRRPPRRRILHWRNHEEAKCHHRHQRGPLPQGARLGRPPRRLPLHRRAHRPRKCLHQPRRRAQAPHPRRNSCCATCSRIASVRLRSRAVNL